MESPSTVQYFDHVIGELMHSQEHKARKFIEYDCIKYDAQMRVFYCGPIPGYNTRTYTMSKNSNGSFSCNCQGYRKKEAEGKFAFCSHIAALIIWFKSRPLKPEQLSFFD